MRLDLAYRPALNTDLCVWLGPDVIVSPATSIVRFEYCGN